MINEIVIKKPGRQANELQLRRIQIFIRDWRLGGDIKQN